MKGKIKKIFIKKRADIAIWGWWQGKNLGDNWIKQSMSSAFKDAIFINTNTSINEFNKYKFVICGGGGLFIRDVHDTWKKEIPVSFGAIGLGAEFKHKNEIALELSEKADFFFVRDEYSAKCMNLKNINRSYDITYFNPLPALKNIKMDKVLFIWRDPEELLQYSDFREYIGKVTQEEKWLEVLESKFRSVTEDTFITNTNYVKELTDNVGFIVSARYHGIIAAIQRGIPCIGIDLCPKIRSLLKENGLEELCLKLSEINKLENKIMECRENAEKIRQKQLDFVSKANSKIKEDIESAVRKINNLI